MGKNLTIYERLRVIGWFKKQKPAEKENPIGFLEARKILGSASKQIRMEISLIPWFKKVEEFIPYLQKDNNIEECLKDLVSTKEGIVLLIMARKNCVDKDFLKVSEKILKTVFSRSLLTFERITWKSPALVLERLIENEAVHPIQGWGDLKRRLSDDRRVYAYFHPALPFDPLIFTEIALTNEISKNVQEIMADGTNKDYNTAVFYSISNCFEGLKGIPFGDLLIQDCAHLLKQDGIKTFATLSPMPGYRKWLEENHKDLANSLKTDPLCRKKENENMAMKYLMDGFDISPPLDIVARFHLGNGAYIGRINTAADLTEKGIKQSYGVMVNYIYNEDTYKNQNKGIKVRNVKLIE